jgi:hypothetical protein
MLTHAGRRRCICTISSVEVLAIWVAIIKVITRRLLCLGVCSVEVPRVWVEAVEAAVQLI